MRLIDLDFINLITELLRIIFDSDTVLNSELRNNSYQADFVVKIGDRRLIVELKSYTTKRTSLSTIGAAIVKLVGLVELSKVTGGLLIITSNIEPVLKNKLENTYGVRIWDRGILLSITEEYPDLRQKLEMILLNLLQSGNEDIFEGTFIQENYNAKDIWVERTISAKKLKIPVINQGNILCDKISRIRKGKKEATLFETTCEECLRYIFQEDMVMWERQKYTTDTLHKFDLIAKIASKNDFWRQLSKDFKSRYVIFEFKNYNETIKQGQIYSTEKYLYLTALRTIAIIISRNGADKNAKTAIAGSLREHGKLIISLDQTDLCKLLQMKDAGDDPNSYMSEIVDSMLMSLSR